MCSSSLASRTDFVLLCTAKPVKCGQFWRKAAFAGTIEYFHFLLLPAETRYKGPFFVRPDRVGRDIFLDNPEVKML
jgi:hypothetical protein